MVGDPAMRDHAGPRDASGSATATDSSGQARNGTYQGTTTKGAAGACLRDNGTAVTFNGSRTPASGPCAAGGSATRPTVCWRHLLRTCIADVSTRDGKPGYHVRLLLRQQMSA